MAAGPGGVPDLDGVSKGMQLLAIASWLVTGGEDSCENDKQDVVGVVGVVGDGDGDGDDGRVARRAISPGRAAISGR